MKERLMSSRTNEAKSSEAYNPYAAPEIVADAPSVEMAGDLAEAEAIRRKYLNHETNIRSIGSLHYLGGILALIGGVVTFVVPFVDRSVEKGASRVSPGVRGIGGVLEHQPRSRGRAEAASPLGAMD
jgi:hypothetical protein